MPRSSPKPLPHTIMWEDNGGARVVCSLDYRRLTNNAHGVRLSQNQSLLKKDLKQLFNLLYIVCVLIFSDIFGLFAYYTQPPKQVAQHVGLSLKGIIIQVRMPKNLTAFSVKSAFKYVVICE